MQDITNIDLHFIVNELSSLENKRLDNIYNFNYAFRFRIEKSDIIVSLKPKAIYLSKYSIDSPPAPTNFVTILRKHLKGKYIRKITQKDWDRIVIFDFDDFKLIFELFSKGNIILIEKETQKIVISFRREEWKDRKIMPGQNYVFPISNKIDPNQITSEKIYELQNEKYGIINVLSSNINIAAPYFEIILEKSGIDKQKTKIEVNEAKIIAEKIKDFCSFINNKPSSLIFSPCASKSNYFSIEVIDSIKFSTLSEAIDSILTPILLQEKEDDEKITKISKKLEMQKKSLEKMILDEKKAKEYGDFIYLNINELEKIMKSNEKSGEVVLSNKKYLWHKQGKKLILED